MSDEGMSQKRGKGMGTHVIAIIQLSHLTQFEQLFLMVELGFFASMRK
jgi:hypothetical protein